MPVTQQQVNAEAAKPLPYFSHDNNAAEDIKCQRLLVRGGFEAYGRWWRVCELMAMYTGHKVPFSTEEDFFILAKQLMFDDEQKLIEFIGLLADVGLINSEALGNGEIVSDRMNVNAQTLAQRKLNGALGGRPKKQQEQVKPTTKTT